MSTNIFAGINGLPSFTTFQLFPCFPALSLIELLIFNFSFYWCVYFFNNTIMTLNLCVVTTLKEIMVPGIPASEHGSPTINYALKTEVAITLQL